MSTYDTDIEDIIPAHLDFLAIFSPELGQNEKTENEQIVFYWSKSAKCRKGKTQQHAEQLTKQTAEEEHERMRQIGLAQGMVSFARTFGGGKDIDSIETERHRVVLRQLEKGWWILASICLTRKRSFPAPQNESSSSNFVPTFEYSSREVSPPVVLLEQLLRGNRIFLLHHGSNLSDLYARLSRTKFCSILDKYWTSFAKSWDVMLHGNPTLDAYHAIRVPAAGELGIGVGEEDWGSGEREAIEGIVRDTEGLVDLLIHRFDVENQSESLSLKSNDGSYYGNLWQSEHLAQGIVFSGVGRVSRWSACAVSEWLQHVAEHPRTAYGVEDNPASARRKLPRKSTSKNADDNDTKVTNRAHDTTAGRNQTDGLTQKDESPHRPPIPPSIVSVIEESLDKATSSAESPKPASDKSAQSPAIASFEPHNRLSSTDWGRYLTFGYGSSWGPVSQNRERDKLITQDPLSRHEDNTHPKPNQQANVTGLRANDLPANHGRFLIGLTGDLDDNPRTHEDDDEEIDGYEGTRLAVRTVHVEVTNESYHPEFQEFSEPYSSSQHSQSGSLSSGTRSCMSMKRVRIVLYQRNPFLYAFLLDPNTASLAIESFYRTLHKQLQALHKSLEASTSPQRVVERLLSAMPSKYEGTPVYDLVIERTNLTVRTSIPSIPALRDDALEQQFPRPWTRLEVLNAHMLTLASIAEVRSNSDIREMSAKNQRDWWVVWMQRGTLGQPDDGDAQIPELEAQPLLPLQEAILLRKSADEITQQGYRRKGRFGRLSLSANPPAFDFGRLIGRESSNEYSNKEDSSDISTVASRVAEGIGIDPRRYVESLFNFSR